MPYASVNGTTREPLVTRSRTLLPAGSPTGSATGSASRPRPLVASRSKPSERSRGAQPLYTPRLSRIDVTLLATVSGGGGFGLLEAATGLSRRQVTDRLMRLGRVLGPVLEIDSDGIRLTVAGAKLLWAGGIYFAAVDAAVARLYSGEPDEASSVVSLQVTDADLAAALSHACPEQSAPLLEISHGSRDRATSALARGEVDLVLLSHDAPARSVDALRSVEVVIEPPVVSLPADSPLARRDVLTEEDLLAVADPVCALQLEPTGAARWWRLTQRDGAAVSGALHLETSTSVAKQLARRDRRPLVSWACGGLGQLAGWRTIPIATQLRRTLRLISDPVVVSDCASAAVAAQVQREHRAQVAVVGEQIARQCSYPEQQPGFVASPVSRPATRGPRRPLDSSDLCLLEAIHEAGSINRAAAMLASSQSVVSRKVQQLEAALGCPVVVRSSTGATLSRPINALLDQVRPHASRLSVVADELGGRRAPGLRSRAVIA